jgi:hypothetical protein
MINALLRVKLSMAKSATTLPRTEPAEIVRSDCVALEYKTSYIGKVEPFEK